MISFREITFIISDFSDISEIVPFIVWAGIKNKGLPYSILGFFFLISGISKIITLITAIWFLNNMPIYHALAICEIGVFYSFYGLITSKKINWLGLTLIFTLELLNSFFFQSIYVFNTNAWTFNSLLIIFLGLRYFYIIYNQEKVNVTLENNPDFIIICAWLIYASGSLFTYIMGSEILSGKSEGFFKNAWFFQCISNIFKNILISYGFILINKK